jgi:hypothetical protein
LLERLLAHDDNFRQFFTSLTDGACGHDHTNPASNSPPATGTGQDPSSNTHHSMGNDIAALLQAMQGDNSTAINSAVTTLGNDVHNAGAAEVSHMTAALNNNHHFEALWHH